MRTFRALAAGGVLVACAIAIVGSWTRINGAGMSCPDWPLCHGAVVPILRGGVVLEWVHRLLAGFETFIVAGLVATGWRLGSAIPILRRMVVALGFVFVLQVALGGATIFLGNSPVSVMIHWGTAMLLLAILTSLVVVAFAFDPLRTTPALAWGGKELLLTTTLCAFVTMCVGAYVSSSGAGLACPSVPGCGPDFFGQGPSQTVQMIHRFLAAILVFCATAAAVFDPRRRSRSTGALRLALSLLAVQVGLGVLNVLWSLPTGLREAHAANAIATFLAFVVATVFALLDESPAHIQVRIPSTHAGERALEGSSV